MNKKLVAKYGVVLVCRCILFCCCVFICNNYSYAQIVSAAIDRDKIVIGEQVVLQLKVEGIENGSSLTKWFNFPDTVNHLQVVSRDNIDTININGVLSFVQKITVTSFDSGLWKFPLLAISYSDSVGSKERIITTENISLTVLPVDVSALKDYHDIKDIIEVEPQKDYWIYGVTGLSVLILLLIVWLIFKPKKKPVVKEIKVSLPGTAFERAMQQIGNLQQENKAGNMLPKLFYQKLDEICRSYFDEQFGTSTLRSTSDEMMLTMKLFLQDEATRTQFYQAVRLSNAVKFAKYIPQQAQEDITISTIKKTLQYLDDISYKMKQGNAY